MRYCTRCVYPAIAATPAHLRRATASAAAAAWRTSATRSTGTSGAGCFEELLDEYRSGTGNYDCIVPVSGGKDSYFQTHVVAKELGLKPLLVTYHGNNYLPEGECNLLPHARGVRLRPHHRPAQRRRRW